MEKATRNVQDLYNEFLQNFLTTKLEKKLRRCDNMNMRLDEMRASNKDDGHGMGTVRK